MSKVTAQTNTNINNRQNNSESKSDRATSKLFYHNGTHKMVFVDKANGDKEYIYDENGSKLYLEDYAIMQMQNDRINLKNKLLSGLDKRQESREKQKAKWFEKYNLENKKYDLFTVAKQAAHKEYMSILNKTKCGKEGIGGIKTYGSMYVGYPR